MDKINGGGNNSGIIWFSKEKQGKVSKHVDYQLASSLFRTGKVFAEKLEVDISNVDEFRKTLSLLMWKQLA